MPGLVDHTQLLERALREQAELRLAWLRGPNAVARPAPLRARLFGGEGQESLEQALREHRYTPEELALLPLQLGELARASVLEEGQRWLGGFLSARVPIGSESRLPGQLAFWLAGSARSGHTPAALLNALDAALRPHAGYCLDLAERAQATYRAQAAISYAPPQPAAGAPQPAGAPQEPAQAAAPESSVKRAEMWLSQTDDAARELTGWLIKRNTAGGLDDGLAALLRALRAPQFDGLARPQRRLFRLAEGARRLGFERDMNARMRAELTEAWLWPLASCVALGVPNDVRVVQAHEDFGLVSDVVAAQVIGEGLALALVSPAQSAVLRCPVGLSVSAALGGVFAQLRADPTYLRRIEALDPATAEPAARHAAIWLLLRVRLAAALLCAYAAPARSADDRISQLMAAGERALGRELPSGLAAATALHEHRVVPDFEALVRGCELHAALRERFDLDYYLNPRVQDVLRGASLRGNLLDAPGFGAELAAHARAGVTRMFELLG